MNVVDNVCASVRTSFLFDLILEFHPILKAVLNRVRVVNTELFLAVYAKLKQVVAENHEDFLLVMIVRFTLEGLD